MKNFSKPLVLIALVVVIGLSFAGCSGSGSKSEQEQRLTGPTDSFGFMLASGGYSVGRGSAVKGKVNIPAYYRPDADSDYLPVTAIADYGFGECKDIKSIILPTGITTIGDWAFSYCHGLTSITIPASLPSIGKEAFLSCYRLTSITLESGIIIGDRAFTSCGKLTSITLGSGITIGNDAFPEGSSGYGGNDLRTTYQSGGAGTYTRVRDSDTWTKQ